MARAERSELFTFSRSFGVRGWDSFVVWVATASWRREEQRLAVFLLSFFVSKQL